MATNAKIETGDPALAIALCWFAVFYSAFMVGYWLWVEYFGIQRKGPKMFKKSVINYIIIIHDS